MNFIQRYLDKLTCKHTWEVYTKTTVYSVNSYGKQIGSHPSGHIHTLHCTTCGKFKKLSL